MSVNTRIFMNKLINIHVASFLMSLLSAIIISQTYFGVIVILSTILLFAYPLIMSGCTLHVFDCMLIENVLFDVGARLRNLKVRVITDSNKAVPFGFFKGPGKDSEVIRMKKLHPVFGRYVKLELPSGYLHICEVEVIGKECRDWGRQIWKKYIVIHIYTFKNKTMKNIKY